MQELTEYKKREKKYQTEIQLLKSQLKKNNSTEKESPVKKPTNSSDLGNAAYINLLIDDLINDQEMNSLIGESGKVDLTEPIDSGWE
jgi:hypothetical protein